MTQRIEKTHTKVLQLEERKRKIEVQLAREKAKLKKQQRKARTRKLIEVGGLAEIAGISEVDRGALLGAMLQMVELLNDKPTFTMLKAKGDELLGKKST